MISEAKLGELGKDLVLDVIVYRLRDHKYPDLLWTEFTAA